ncbi:MAG: ornithine cyclodeaminase family protein [Candidatus Nanopelagicales bacterium]|jgi:ornithine cyclodeaminase|nr:ornithine cyclodeaminase family protein [Candidatus Nanopelagicales bacterium]MDP4715272.1 ornithine cyclodeaminase family protein [Candidatus Nanopelagicales bacterium]MDP5095172.1 ornithine cyclodeaminase family protein [Candidatus Nanopelagicales bacterium]
MRFLSEEQTAALITHEIAYDAVKSAFISAASGTATVFPAVIAHGADPANVFTLKSGSSTDYAGVKIGSYWPCNDSRGIPRHGTTVLVIDQATGHIAAAVEAAKVNAYRTAAADAVAADVLALPEARTLTVFGNGHQAFYGCLALTRIRPIERILVVARDPGRGERFCRQLVDHGLHAVVTPAQQACTEADIITAATNATSPLFDAGWVTPGTHVASIGSDSRGKQELPTGLHDRARLFCDLPTQSMNIGEFQHVANRVASGALTLTAIGSVLNGTAPGRVSADDITIFDSSGIALQDLAVATALLELAGS